MTAPDAAVLTLSSRVLVRRTGCAEVETSWAQFLDDNVGLGMGRLGQIEATLRETRAYVGDGVSVRVVAS